MFKVIALQFLIFSAILSAHISPEYLFSNLDTITLKRDTISLDSAISLLTDTVYQEEFHYYTPDTNSFFYLADINANGTSELLYEGTTYKSDGKNVVPLINVFLKVWSFNNSVKKIGEVPGRLVKTNGDYIFVNQVERYGSDVDLSSKYSINNDTLKKNDVVRFFWNVKSPSKVTEPIVIKILNTNYYLRSSPRINNDKISAGTDLYPCVKGNVLIELAKGTIATVTSEHTDSIGNDWWFIVIDKKEVLRCDILEGRTDGYTENNIIRDCGWISRKYLEFEVVE